MNPNVRVKVTIDSSGKLTIEEEIQPVPGRRRAKNRARWPGTPLGIGETRKMDHYQSKTYSHKVDAKGIIVNVSDNWQSFAEENLGVSTCLPKNVIGTHLFDHIQDPETKHLYELIMHKVRKYRRNAMISFRCDAPDKRRYLELTVIPLKDGSLEFKSQIIRTELREFVELMRSDIERSEEYLKICSMCKKIAISET